MDLVVVGIDHRTAPVAVREQIAITPERMGHALHDLKGTPGLDEVAILSTCNRTEIYAVQSENDHGSLSAWLAKYHDIPMETLRDSIYVYSGDASVRHLLRVASGLDSMVLGEPQIFGQVKDCFTQAKSHNTLGSVLERISQHTYRIAKRVRSSTAIGQTPVSVASIAVDLAAQLFSSIAGCNVLLVGAGETVELVGKYLQQAGVERITIANRTIENAHRLAESMGGDAITLTDIPTRLSQIDILIASTGSELPILGKGTVERALKERRHSPIFMVDLAVPRDIEPEIADLRDVYLYSIDDLEQLIAENITNREEAAQEAEAIITEALSELEAEDKSRSAVDILVRFRQQNEAIKDVELGKALDRLERGEAPEKVMMHLANQLTNKIIHNPSVQLKQASAEGRDNVVQALAELFQLDPDDEEGK
ncbi:MAG: glutamyl-tRNA reductase [Gammaproteobacteria bacterium]|nr:glutamyl-tRNA reductase [Gammaproteobacteria bacterium]